MKVIKYKYNGSEFSTSQQVRQALGNGPEKIAFGPEPDYSSSDEEKRIFWETLGVEYLVSEIPDPEQYEPTLEDKKRQKLEELENKFQSWYESDAVVTSSLGFVADSDARAMTDVNGLITVAESMTEESRSNIAFMDHNNETQFLNFEQLKKLQLEIIQNGQAAYQQKWAYRTAIETATEKTEIDDIEIVFSGMNFAEGNN